MVATDAGDFRIVKSDASETVRQVIFENPSENLVLGATDPRLAPIVPMSQASFREDDKILIEYKTGTATTVTGATSSLRIPIRRKNNSTGNVADTYLRSGDLLAAGQITVPASTWTKLGSYTIPGQTECRIGNSIAENSRIYVSLVE